MTSSTARRCAVTLALVHMASGCKNPESAPIADGAPRIAESQDGVRIQYRVRGTGEPLLVLIHGWSCDADYWREQLPALTPHHTVLTVDLAGHGASGCDRDGWTMEKFGADVVAAVRAYRREEREAAQDVVLVGHSMGGPVAIEAARQLGAEVSGIIGVDTFSTLGAPPFPAAALEPFLAGFEADFSGMTRAWVSRSMFQPTADPAFVRRIADDMAQAPPAVAIGAMRELLPVLFRSDYRDIAVPIVAINADLEGVTDEARARTVAPTFRLVTLPGRGHFLMLEDPAGFNPVLLQEVARLAR